MTPGSNSTASSPANFQADPPPSPEHFPPHNLFKHIRNTYNHRCCDPPFSSVTNGQVIDQLTHYFECYRSHDPTILLRGVGPVYRILNEVGTFLRLNHDLEGNMLQAFTETENELAVTALEYMDCWEANPALQRQLLEVE